MAGNIYVVEDGDELVVIDTGISRDYRMLVDAIKSMGRSPVEVGHILLTHFHADHTGSAAALKRLSRARVYAHKNDVPFIEGTSTMSSIYRKGILGRIVSLAPAAARSLSSVIPVDVDEPLKDRQTIDLLGGLKVIHAPGHTPGSACFFWESEGILFTGDAIINRYLFFTLPTIGFSWDFDQAAASARKVVDRVEDDSVRLVCPGHGAMVEDYAKDKLFRFRGRMIRRYGV